MLVPFQHILCTVTATQLQSRSGQQYSLEKEDYNNIISSILKISDEVIDSNNVDSF